MRVVAAASGCRQRSDVVVRRGYQRPTVTPLLSKSCALLGCSPSRRTPRVGARSRAACEERARTQYMRTRTRTPHARTHARTRVHACIHARENAHACARAREVRRSGPGHSRARAHTYPHHRLPHRIQSCSYLHQPHPGHTEGACHVRGGGGGIALRRTGVRAERAHDMQASDRAGTRLRDALPRARTVPKRREPSGRTCARRKRT